MNSIKYRNLKNGLRIVGEEIPYVKSISIGVWLNVGTRNEVGYSSGISHFIEHMLFKGTKNRDSSKISRDIDYYGGFINAFTNHDNTCYHVKMPYNRYDIGIEVLSDILINSLFLDSEIEKERSVICDEIRMYEDSPEDYVYEKLMSNTFDNKGIGRNILGTVESVENIKREEIVDYFAKHYLPNNAVIVASGNFDFDELVESIERHFIGWKKGDLDERKEDQIFKSCRYIEDRDDEQANICVIFESVDDTDSKDFYSVKLISNILGNSPSSRLFQKIREKEGLCYSIYTADNFYYGCSEFGIYSSSSNERVKKIYDMIMNEVELIKDKGITEEELDFSKKQLEGISLMSVESTEDRMLYLGEYEVKGEKIKDVDEVISIIESIDIDYINKVAKKIFNGPMSVGITGRGVERIWR